MFRKWMNKIREEREERKIHRDEMEYAMRQKGRELIEQLKEKGVYPYTGINRRSVLE